MLLTRTLRSLTISLPVSWWLMAHVQMCVWASPKHSAAVDKMRRQALAALALALPCGPEAGHSHLQGQAPRGAQTRSGRK